MIITVALGQIPWLGSLAAATYKMKTDKSNSRRESLQNMWIEEYSIKVKKLTGTIEDITSRLNNLGDEIEDRIQSEQYLDIVRKSFKAWDNANTDEKRKYIANLISNAAGTNLCSDDVLRMFIDWLNLYDEIHFAIIKVIYNGSGPTRYDMWKGISTEEIPREDSAEADLFKKLIRDLSTGGVIRQARDTTEDGQWVKKKLGGPRTKSTTMESAFEDTKQYVLTELGKQFVHYTMNDVVKRVGE
jgi:hypothetical protein